MRPTSLFGSGERDFRWRGASVSRIEGLSDGVFALALTLIVVALEVPTSYAELIELFVQVPVFAACFTLLVVLWFVHHRFHRRFGLEDTRTLLLNALLLFLVLLYVYPLRFMAEFLYNALLLRRVAPSASMSWSEARTLMLIYGAGVVSIYGVYALMYAHAWSKRAELQLDSVERVLTKSEMHAHLLSAGIGVVSIAIAAANAAWIPYAGFAYALMGPVHGVHGWLTGRALERFRGKVPGAPMP